MSRFGEHRRQMKRYFLIVKDDYCIADAVRTSAAYGPRFETLEFAADLFDRIQYCSDVTS